VCELLSFPNLQLGVVVRSNSRNRFNGLPVRANESE